MKTERFVEDAEILRYLVDVTWRRKVKYPGITGQGD